MKSKRYKSVLWLLCFVLFLPGNLLASNDNQSDVTVIKLAALLPMSGELASKGEVRKLAIEKGVVDTNDRWKSEGAGLQFKLVVEDSESDPMMVLEKAQQLYEQGFQLFIVGSSREVESLQQWAEERQVIIISYSSTSPDLGIVDDQVFRMVPNDIEQAKALADLLEYEGVYGIVPVYRNDVYGQQLAELLKEEFVQRHGIVSEAIIYEPQQSDWESITSRIVEEVQQLAIERDRIAIVVIAFDELGDLLLHSDGIDHLRWFGADTVTLSPIVLQNEAVAKQALKVNLKGTTFGLPDVPELLAVQSYLAETIGETPLSDAMFAYDIPGLLASIIDQSSQPLNIVEIKDNMVAGSAIYAGITGWMMLDEQGDRKYYHYDIWEVQSAENDFYWERAAKYVRNPGMPGYIQPYDRHTEDQLELEASFLLGFSDQMLDLQRTLTRAEYTWMLMNALNDESSTGQSLQPTFIDAAEIDPRAQQAVARAEALKIVQGYGNHDFRPNREVTWLEALSMIVKAMDWPLVDTTKEANALDIALPDWAKPYVTTAIAQQFISDLEQSQDFLKGDLQLGDASLMMLEIMQRSDKQ